MVTWGMTIIDQGLRKFNKIGKTPIYMVKGIKTMIVYLRYQIRKMKAHLLLSTVVDKTELITIYVCSLYFYF